MIIDAHVHLVTRPMLEGVRKKFDQQAPGVLQKTISGGKGFLKNSFLEFISESTIESLAGDWIKELDRHGIDKACFLPITEEGMEDIDQFVKLRPDRFCGGLFIDDPISKTAIEKLERWQKKGSVRFIKLYPSMSHFHANDKRLFPFYELAGELDMPILFHFGITTAPIADYQFTNPIEIRLPAKCFPKTKFIIAHFGAGFFRELLLLGFHSDNLYVDSSGTNNWRKFLPKVMPLSEIFRRTKSVFGADHILYGTDSVLNGTEGYRKAVLKEQKRSAATAKFSQRELELFFSENARNLFAL